MKLAEIRQRFFDFFKKNHHPILPSSPVIPHEDPTLLFVNAGMNQFKDIFLGSQKTEYSCAATSQKCIRVGGKHNDLENVGHTSRHLTFFEMFGNFSFGSYFKKEAIAFAWKVSLEVFGIDPEKVWATVFYEDQEAFDLWKEYLPEEKIVRMGEKDNFWSMGEVGPCGPCSELLYDRGEAYGSARSPAEDFEGERFLEFWNLVFMQYDKDASGVFHDLPKKCIDTGGGLERMACLLQGVDSVFKIDLFTSLIEQIQKFTDIPYDFNDSHAAAFHVIADHLRTLAFAISDGAVPSNIERGYVLRKVLRRATRYARTLGIDHPFLGELVPHLIRLMGSTFPELVAAEQRIIQIITQEEQSFLKTLKKGGALLQTVLEDAVRCDHYISGQDAFKLKDTYGFPIEEILLIAKDAGVKVDLKEFEDLEHEAKEKSKKARKSHLKEDLSTFQVFEKEHPPSTFLGYETLSNEAVILGLMHEGELVEALYEGQEGFVILDQTCFYAEKGGQVGDEGTLEAQDAVFQVLDCQSPLNTLIVHHGVVQKGTLTLSKQVRAIVDAQRRQAIAANHSATHLLHAALRSVLGEHIKQAGSVVEPTRLRFDFLHHQPLTAQEIKAIESFVNQKVISNRNVKVYEVSLKEAQQDPTIIQIFGEKYGDLVRVIDMGFSKELCGGTHAQALGQIGLFKITKEASISSGVRRIEAVTGIEALNLINQWQQDLQEIQILTKAKPKEEVIKVRGLLEEKKALREDLDHQVKQNLHLYAQDLLTHVKKIHGTDTLIIQTKFSFKHLKTLSDLLMQNAKSLALLIFNEDPPRTQVLARLSDDLVKQKMDAGDWLKEALIPLNGKGGGKKAMAQGACENLENLHEAQKQAERYFTLFAKPL